VTDSYRSELIELVERVFVEDLGGRASKAQVVDRIATTELPPGAENYFIRVGASSVVQSYFRTKGAEGLPQAPQVNDEGEHAQQGLWTLEEYHYLARQYLDRSHSNRVQAEKVAAECARVYGVTLDLEQLAQESA
jgi:hypothetical protein